MKTTGFPFPALLFIAGVSALHLCIAFGLYLFIAPFSAIPSDDTLYALEILRYSDCLNHQAFCLPPVYGIATKPVFIALSTGAYLLFPHFLGDSTYNAMALVSFLSLAGIGMTLHFLLKPYHSPFLHLLIPFVFYGSVTITANQLWLGYDTMMTLFILLAFISLFQFLKADEEEEKLFPLRSLFWGGAFLCSGLLAFFSHITAALYLASGMIASLVLLFFVHEEDVLKGKLRKLRIRRLLSINGIFLLCLFTFDWFSAGLQGASYLIAYFYNVQANVHDQIYTYGPTTPSGIHSVYFTGGKDMLLFRLTIPFYYLLTETSALLTISILLLWCSLWKWRERTPLPWKRFLTSQRGFLYLCGIIALLLLSFAPNEKLLRVFYPLHPLFLLLMLSLLNLLFAAYKEEVIGGRRRTLLCTLLALVLFNTVFACQQSYFLCKGVYGIQKELAPFIREKERFSIAYNPAEKVWERPFQSGLSAFFSVRPLMVIFEDSFKWRLTANPEKLTLAKGGATEKTDFFLTGEKTTSRPLLKQFPFLAGNGSDAFYFESANTSQYAIKKFLARPLPSLWQSMNPVAVYRQKGQLYLYGRKEN